ncbi:hypothetical protein [Desulfosediminicola ganghwensis]|uniref:hypothetical protein n=1 Tax=Desulfosediminicola ganghwensis TaxID=2569540 RepID=UPI0010AB5215|nr:hypothetical protein [Desulfosediminicola ganghwensis]
MTVLIGITQASEKTEQKIFTEFKGVGTTAIVGPFKSSDEASNWMHFMMSRSGAYKHIQSPSSDVGEHWYGFTCECIESTDDHHQSAV